ncbi:MAG: hypothetical protein ABJC04_08415 [Verrucomicrobiota bacterium]
MEHYEEWNSHPATNWVQVNQVIKIDIIERTFPVSSRYVFAQNLGLHAKEGDVVLLGTSPIREDGRKDGGRYAIIRNQLGFHYEWFPEEKVQQMLTKAGVKELPKPEPWTPSTNAAVQSPPAQPSNAVAPDSLPNDQTHPSNFKSPQNTNPVNEIVATTPPPQPKTALAVIVALIAGVILFFFLRRRKRQ